MSRLSSSMHARNAHFNQTVQVRKCMELMLVLFVWTKCCGKDVVLLTYRIQNSQSKEKREQQDHFLANSVPWRYLSRLDAMQLKGKALSRLEFCSFKSTCRAALHHAALHCCQKIQKLLCSLLDVCFVQPPWKTEIAWAGFSNFQRAVISSLFTGMRDIPGNLTTKSPRFGEKPAS